MTIAEESGLRGASEDDRQRRLLQRQKYPYTVTFRPRTDYPRPTLPQRPPSTQPLRQCSWAPSNVKYYRMMKVGNILEKGEGFVVACSGSKVYLGLDTSGHVALYNPYPFLQWTDKIQGEKLRYGSRGLELLDQNGAVVKTYFERTCPVGSTRMKMILTRDGEVQFKVSGKLVGVLDDNGHARHFDCPLIGGSAADVADEEVNPTTPTRNEGTTIKGQKNRHSFWH